MKKALVIARIPVDGAALEDASEAFQRAKSGEDPEARSFEAATDYHAGPKLAAVKALAEEHGAEFDGTGTSAQTIDAFLYILPERAAALVAALKARGFEATEHGVPRK